LSCALDRRQQQHGTHVIWFAAAVMMGFGWQQLVASGGGLLVYAVLSCVVGVRRKSTGCVHVCVCCAAATAAALIKFGRQQLVVSGGGMRRSST
jgi:hypothetical protein